MTMKKYFLIALVLAMAGLGWWAWSQRRPGALTTPAKPGTTIEQPQAWDSMSDIESELKSTEPQEPSFTELDNDLNLWDRL